MTEISDFLPIIVVIGSIAVYFIIQILLEIRARKRRKRYQHKLEIRDLKLEELEKELERLKKSDINEIK